MLLQGRCDQTGLGVPADLGVEEERGGLQRLLAALVPLPGIWACPLHVHTCAGNPGHLDLPRPALSPTHVSFGASSALSSGSLAMLFSEGSLRKGLLRALSV